MRIAPNTSVPFLSEVQDIPEDTLAINPHLVGTRDQRPTRASRALRKAEKQDWIRQE